MATTTTTTDTIPGTAEDGAAKRAAGGAFAGFFVDMFDVYLPIVALAPAAAYFKADDVSVATAGLIATIIFVATLIGRPIGALIFGHFADKVGRRRIAMLSVGGFGVVTLMIAFLPGYQQIGITAIVLLIVLRFIDGIFLGGEYTAASPLAMEQAPKEKRGLYGALIMTGFPLAYVAISMLTLVMLQVAPAGGIDSPYVQWGWRIPFVIGALLAFGFVFFYARSVEESKVFEESTDKTKNPLKELFSGDTRRDFFQVFVLMSGLWLTLYMVTAVLPGLLTSEVGLSSTAKTATVLVANVVLAIAYVGAGVLSQRIGRRTLYRAAGLIAAVVGSLLYGIVVNLTTGDLLWVVLLTILINVVVVSGWGAITTYINERFHTGVRSSGFGLGYSLAVVLPSFYGFYQGALGEFMPARYTPLVLLVIGGLLMTVGAQMGPETKDVDMQAAPVRV